MKINYIVTAWTQIVRETKICSFCGRPSAAHRRLICSPVAMICWECAECCTLMTQAMRVIGFDDLETLTEPGLAGFVGSMTAPLLTPAEILAHFRRKDRHWLRAAVNRGLIEAVNVGGAATVPGISTASSPWTRCRWSRIWRNCTGWKLKGGMGCENTV